MIRWLYLKLLGLLQQQCDHPPEHVAADILEGDFIEHHLSIRHCNVCGAVGPVYHGTHGFWRRPRADWVEDSPMRLRPSHVQRGSDG